MYEELTSWPHGALKVVSLTDPVHARLRVHPNLYSYVTYLSFRLP